MQSTGIETARLTASASARFMPSTLSGGRSQRRCMSRLIGQEPVQQVVAKGVAPARDHPVVAVAHLAERQVSRGIERVGERAARRDVDRVRAGLLEPPAHLHRLVDRVAAAEPEQERIRLLPDADLDLQVEVVTDLAPDGTYGLDQEPGAVLERAAVVVLAVVDRGGEELREEVPVRTVDLDPVEARLPRSAGAGREAPGDVPELRRRRALRREAVERIALAGGAEPACELDPGEVALTTAVGELEDVPAAMLVDARRPSSRQNGIRSSRLDRCVARDDEPSPVDSAPGGDDRPDAAPGEAKLPVDPRSRAGAVEVVEAARDARTKDPIRDLEVAEPQRREDRVGQGYPNSGGSKTERISRTISSREAKRLSS